MRDSLENPRAYLQQRVALFTGVSCLFFGVLLLVDFATPAIGEPLMSSTRVASMTVLAVNAIVWRFTARGERRGRASRAAELAAIATAMGAFTALPLFPPVEGAGGVMTMFMPVVMAVVLLLRSAIIPSPPWLSVAVGLAWGGLMSTSAVLGWEGVQIEIPGQPASDLWLLPLSVAMFATVAISFVAGVTSRVVFGLQTRVRKAMQLGQYTLEAKLGEGGMGSVYRAQHRMLRRPTAVKLLPPDKAGEEAIARFEREVQQTSRLSHPNTIAIFDFGRTSDGVFYYAMEYLDGVSLQTLVEMGGPLPPERAIHILVQVAGALTEAHELGLVHRDIKPDNIVLCERGGMPDVVKVLDFGLVKDIEAPDDAGLTAVNIVQGTPMYIAPETLTDPTTIDARADLYALGAVAYFLVVGEPVFGGKLIEVLSHHLRTMPEPPSRRTDAIDEQLEAVIMRCLEKDPSDRYASAAELADALGECPTDRAWTHGRAHQWWDAERENIQSRRTAGVEPASLTVAPI